jgi:hypothetical protein
MAAFVAEAAARSLQGYSSSLLGSPRLKSLLDMNVFKTFSVVPCVGIRLAFMLVKLFWPSVDLRILVLALTPPICCVFINPSDQSCPVD